MHVTDLAINKTLGMQLAPAGHGHILEMPESPLLLNHVGTIHASGQFALAEAASGEFLLGHLGEAQGRVFAVLRTSDVKFRKPAHGNLRASARLRAVCGGCWRVTRGGVGGAWTGFGFGARRSFGRAGRGDHERTVRLVFAETDQGVCLTSNRS